MATKGPLKKYGTLSLHSAARTGNLKFLQQEIEQGKQPIDSRAADGETPLFSATRYDRQDVARWLLEHKADVNAKSTKGKSPLHIAVSYGFTKLIEIFHFFGVDLDPVDNDNMTPLCLSVRNSLTTTTQLLLSLSADPNHDNGLPLLLARRTTLNISAVSGEAPCMIIQELAKYGAYLPAPMERLHTPITTQVAYTIGESDRVIELERLLHLEETLLIFLPVVLETCVLEYEPHYKNNYLPFKRVREEQQMRAREQVREQAREQQPRKLQEKNAINEEYDLDAFQIEVTERMNQLEISFGRLNLK